MKNLFLSLIIFYIGLVRKIFCLSRSLHYLEEKCVMNDFYLKSNIIITFNVTEGYLREHKINGPIFVINIYNKDTNRLIRAFNTQKTYGKFSFYVERTGHYKTCIISNDTFIFGQQRFIIYDFNVESSLDVKQKGKENANLKDFEVVNHRMQIINDKVDQIENMQLFGNSIENLFSKNQIKVSKRIVQILIIQILIILIVGVYHVYTLNNMFKERITMSF
jgi:hypothetical protein